MTDAKNQLVDTFLLRYYNGNMAVTVEDQVETLDEAVYRIEGFLKACGFEFKDLIIQR